MLDHISIGARNTSSREMLIVDNQGAFTCNNCNSNFKTKEALTTHAESFCKVMPQIHTDRMKEQRIQGPLQLKPILKNAPRITSSNSPKDALANTSMPSPQPAIHNDLNQEGVLN